MKRQKGFALIEFLVVIAVLVILLGIGIMNWTKIKARKELNNAALTMYTDLRRCQVMAITTGRCELDVPNYQHATDYTIRAGNFTLTRQFDRQIYANCNFGNLTFERLGTIKALNNAKCSLFHALLSTSKDITFNSIGRITLK